MTDGSERDCVFLLSVRDERALHGCERALVADAEPQRLLLFSLGGLLLSRSAVAATGDACAAALKIFGIGDARSAWPWMAERRTRCQFPLGGCRWFRRWRFGTARLLRLARIQHLAAIAGDGLVRHLDAGVLVQHDTNSFIRGFAFPQAQ